GVERLVGRFVGKIRRPVRIGFSTVRSFQVVGVAPVLDRGRQRDRLFLFHARAHEQAREDLVLRRIDVDLAGVVGQAHFDLRFVELERVRASVRDPALQLVVLAQLVDGEIQPGLRRVARAGGVEKMARLEVLGARDHREAAEQDRKRRDHPQHEHARDATMARAGSWRVHRSLPLRVPSPITGAAPPFEGTLRKLRFARKVPRDRADTSMSRGTSRSGNVTWASSRISRWMRTMTGVVAGSSHWSDQSVSSPSSSSVRYSNLPLRIWSSSTTGSFSGGLPSSRSKPLSISLPNCNWRPPEPPPTSSRVWTYGPPFDR